MRKTIKNVAIIHPTFGYKGGAESLILWTLEEWYKIGIKSTVYTKRIRENTPSYINQKYTNISINPFTFNKTSKYLVEELVNFDALVVHNFPATIFFGLANKLAEKDNIKLPKSFWYCHEPSVRLYGYDEKSYSKKAKTLDIVSRYTIMLDRYGVSKIDYIFANSIRTKEHIKRVYLKDTEVIYPGIKNISIINRREPKHFCYIGRIEKPKNLDNAIIAFNDFIKRNLDGKLKFMIAGRGRYEKKLKNLIKKLRISDRVVFLGYISEEEKRNLLSKSYALIMPAINEPFGLTVIEAFYSSCISIISKDSGVSEIVNDASIICDTSNYKNICEGMINLFTSKNIRNNLIQNGINIINDGVFSVKTHAENMLNAIEEKL